MIKNVSDQFSLLRALAAEDPKVINSLDLVRFLKPYLNLRTHNTCKLKDERTPLHWAASSGSIDIARFLIDQKAEVDTPDNSGWTPLHIAGTGSSKVSPRHPDNNLQR